MRLHFITKLLAKFCDNQSSRYALGGVYCESTGERSAMTATDGRFLASVAYGDACDEQEPVVIESKGLVKAFNATAPGKNGGDFQKLSVSSGHAHVECKGALPCEIIEGRFPRYRDVFPSAEKPDGYHCVSVDPKMLKIIAELFAGVTTDQKKSVQVWVSEDESKPMLFSHVTAGGDAVRSVVMPVSGEEHTWPSEHGVADEEPADAEEETPAPPPECVDEDTLAQSFADETDEDAGEYEEDDDEEEEEEDGEVDDLAPVCGSL